MNPKKIIVVCGPTASGKTAMAIRIAQEYHAEILSFDSRQFYRELVIGSAMPAKSELASVKHHFIAHLSIQDTYNAAHYAADARKFASDYFLEHDLLVMAGGSGLYLEAFLHGLDDIPEISPAVREGIEKLYHDKGIEALQKELEKSDPDYYAQVDRQNPRRLIRALEVIRGTGKAYSSWRTKTSTPLPYEISMLMPELSRGELYERINRRTDEMMQSGLMEEARSLYACRHHNALQTVGYKECFDYIEGKTSLSETIELIKKNTRNYAKRQLTWFRKKLAG